VLRVSRADLAPDPAPDHQQAPVKAGDARGARAGDRHRPRAHRPRSRAGPARWNAPHDCRHDPGRDDRRRRDPDGSVVCAAKGFRLRFDIRGKRQRIVLDPFATEANPEVLSGLRPRLLVEAEYVPYHRLSAEPAMLAHLKLSKPCDHFMFDFGDWVYLGEVATGQIAPLIRGSDAR